MNPLTATRITRETKPFPGMTAGYTDFMEEDIVPWFMRPRTAGAGFPRILMMLGRKKILLISQYDVLRDPGIPDLLENWPAGKELETGTDLPPGFQRNHIQASISELAAESFQDSEMAEKTDEPQRINGRRISLSQARKGARRAIKQAALRYRKAVEWEGERGFRFEDE